MCSNRVEGNPCVALSRIGNIGLGYVKLLTTYYCKIFYKQKIIN